MGGRSIGDALNALDSLAKLDTSIPTVELGDDVSPFGNRPALHRSLLGGDQWEFKFANGYGASVVRHSGSYGSQNGLWELVVLGQDGHLTYETQITDNVIGHLAEDDVVKLLERIEALSD